MWSLTMPVQFLTFKQQHKIQNNQHNTVNEHQKKAPQALVFRKE